MSRRILKKSKLKYNILVSDNFSKLQKFISNTKMCNKKILIITDSTVKRLYINKLFTIFNKNKNLVFVYTIRCGDQYKNLNTCEQIYKFLLKNNFTRNDMIFAFGGGNVSDLAGFISGTYMRGIQYAIIPTTMLSMCDASIGGKTAVNFGDIKNPIGVFKDPSFVYINVELVLSLNSCDYTSGLVEAIKHAIIDDASLYEYIEKNKELILNRDIEALIYVINRSLKVKKKYILRDPFDYNERHILNFGHTFGHAIESIENFKLRHGNCIAIGMRMAMEMSKFSEIERIVKLFEYFGIKTSYSIKNMKKVIHYIKKDKKRNAEKIKFIFVKKIGKAYIKEINI